MKVMFICLGNICRSPLAEAMFRQMIDQAGLADQVTIDSAGTSSEETGHPPYPGIQKIMNKYGLDSRGLAARQLTRQDFYDADLMIGMDEMNLADIHAMAPVDAVADIHGIYDLIPDKRGDSIPDPWYTHRFQDTYDALAEAMPSWLRYVKEQLKR